MNLLTQTFKVIWYTIQAPETFFSCLLVLLTIFIEFLLGIFDDIIEVSGNNAQIAMFCEDYIFPTLMDAQEGIWGVLKEWDMIEED